MWMMVLDDNLAIYIHISPTPANLLPITSLFNPSPPPLYRFSLELSLFSPINPISHLITALVIDSPICIMMWRAKGMYHDVTG